MGRRRTPCGSRYGFTVLNSRATLATLAVLTTRATLAILTTRHLLCAIERPHHAACVRWHMTCRSGYSKYSKYSQYSQHSHSKTEVPMENQLTLHRAVHLTSHRTVQLTLYRARANRANGAHARKPPACRQRPSRGVEPPILRGSTLGDRRPPSARSPPVTSASLVYPQSTSVNGAHARSSFLVCRRKPACATEQPSRGWTPSNCQSNGAGSPPPVTGGFLIYRPRVASEPHW